MKFLGGATSLDSFLKDYRTKETKGFFPYGWFDFTEKMNNKELPPYDFFFSILRKSNPLEKDNNDFQNLVNSGLTTEQAVVKLRMDRIPPTGAENSSYLQSVWENNNMQLFSDFLNWYNNKNVVPTLEAMQKKIDIYQNNGIDMLKLGSTLPNLAKICLHKSTDSKFYNFIQNRIKICLRRYEKIWLAVLFLSSHVKLWWMKLLYANHQTCANQLLVSMLVSFILTQCVNQGLLDCIRAGSTILKPRDSQLAKTDPAPLRIWLCRIFNKVVQSAKVRLMLLLVDKRKLIASV